MLTRPKPGGDLLELEITLEPIIAGPHVAAIVDGLRVTAGTVRPETVVKAHFVPTDILKRTISIGDDPVWRRVGDNVDEGGSDARQTGRQTHETERVARLRHLSGLQFFSNPVFDG